MADAVARLRAAREDLKKARQSLEQKLARWSSSCGRRLPTSGRPKVPLGDALKAAGVSNLRWSFPAMCNFNCAGNPEAPVPEGTTGLHYVDNWRNQCERSGTPKCKQATVCPPGFARVQGNVPTECVASFDYGQVRDMAAARLGVASSDASLNPCPQASPVNVSRQSERRPERMEPCAERPRRNPGTTQSRESGLLALGGGGNPVRRAAHNRQSQRIPASSAVFRHRDQGRRAIETGRPIQMTPVAASGCPAEIPACLPAKGEAQANVEVELRWSEWGGIASLIRGTGALPAPVIDGSLSVDLGFGQLVLPLEIGP